MQQVYRFGPAPEHPANHLFVFLHASGADARSMIPAAFQVPIALPERGADRAEGFARYWQRRRSAAVVLEPGLNEDNRLARVSAILPRIEQMVRGSRRPIACHWNARC
jgi:hypothetical protein